MLGQVDLPGDAGDVAVEGTDGRRVEDPVGEPAQVLHGVQSCLQYHDLEFATAVLRVHGVDL